LGSHTKNDKIQKIIEARKECWNVEERLELVEEV
jgi:hypothetical protein